MQYDCYLNMHTKQFLLVKEKKKNKIFSPFLVRDTNGKIIEMSLCV